MFSKINTNKILSDVGTNESSNKSCVFCANNKTEEILLSTKQSITTDGCIVNSVLSKHQCLKCGLFFNPETMEILDYKRSSGDSRFDILRHKHVADGIYEILNNFLPTKDQIYILEIGGGNFQTSLNLSKRDKRFNITCIEPFPETERFPDEIKCLKIAVDDYYPERKFDFVFSNQVIEHINDPVSFVKTIGRLLNNEGLILFCCPTQSQISSETLFVDHLYHFSELSFQILVNKAGYILFDEFVAPWDKLTHCYTVKKEGQNCSVNNRIPPHKSMKLRQNLADKWTSLDEKLLYGIKDFAGPLYLFGAGEFSQLLECYAPDVFDKVSAIIVSDKKGHRSFNKKILLVEQLKPNSGIVLLGVREEIRDSVSNYLIKIGWLPSNIISDF